MNGYVTTNSAVSSYSVWSTWSGGFDPPDSFIGAFIPAPFRPSFDGGIALEVPVNA